MQVESFIRPTSPTEIVKRHLDRRGRWFALDQLVGPWRHAQPGRRLLSPARLPTRDVHRRLMPVAADYEHVVVDTPPGELSIACGALMAAEVALVAVPPTPIDLDRVMPTLELVADVEDVTGVGFFLRDFAYDNDTDGMRVVRALLLELRDDPGLASRVLGRTGEL